MAPDRKAAAMPHAPIARDLLQTGDVLLGLTTQIPLCDERLLDLGADPATRAFFFPIP